MLQAISWMQWMGGIAVLASGYYTVVVVGYFRKELRAIIRRLAGKHLGSENGPTDKE